jgi:aminoglycoside phosphotransferase (APT) family kinase protein
MSDAETGQVVWSLLTSVSASTAQMLGIPSREELIKYYCESRRPNIDINEQLRWVWFYMSFYWWKTATVFQGIAARSVRGQASSSIADSVGKCAPVMGLMAIYALSKLDSDVGARL